MGDLFSAEVSEHFLKINCPANLNAQASNEFTNQSKGWMLNPKPNIVIDFMGVLAISRDFYRAVIQFKNILKRNEKSVFSLNLSESLLQQIKDDGLETAFKPIQSLAEIVPKKAKTPTGKSSPLNVEFINPFLTAIEKTLKIQCKTDIKILKPFLKKEASPDITIASVLSLISKNFSGSVVLCFSESVFLRIYENMFEEKHTEITAEMEDAAGELLNIVYGMAKTELNTKGYSFQKALPTVLRGEKIKIRQIGLKPAVVVPLETEVGLFYLEIEFDDSNTGSQH